ncbi:MAG: TIGR03960 family B12-binding radical SAM protein [Desulfobulbaceae bacterium]|nr:TIGR03960 family B12-binding radical SAM protein [Desulfobulbaceae bacterium]
MSNHVNIDHILPLVRKPGRYIGGEFNAATKRSCDVDLCFCLVFPDLYEIGMSHQGLQILYHILNRQNRVLAHRCYTPDIDMERELRRHGVPLFSLEEKLPLANYDLIGFTLPYELCYTNILTVLDLAGIPLYAEDRTKSPLVIGGGSCSLNPEPVADFFDAIVLGDGEEVIVDISNTMKSAKEAGLTRKAVLEQLSAIQGVYIPSFFRPEYDGESLSRIVPLKEGYEYVSRRVLPELPTADYLEHPLVPLVKPVHDRLGVEIARGCTRGCRFCQAGMIYRPVRERSIDDIMELARKGIDNSGFDELALLSLSTGDFSCIGDLMAKLMDEFAREYVSVSMPSMRVGTLTPEIMSQIRRVRKTGFTVAPEAGTDRLREVINKGITEEDLLTTCRDAFTLGWNLIKFHFMLGLPTETEEDVDAIVDLAQKARNEAGQKGRRAQINVSVATFIPKPHTPFQWEAQISLEESRARINRLKKLLPRKGFKLKWHDPDQSMLEGVFSRGDRRLAGLIETAWQSGVRLDGWSEHYHLENWKQAARVCGIELEQYLRGRGMGEVLPWDHLHCGVDRSFLEKEYQQALERAYTPDCRYHGCQQCGLCDFKTIRPVINPETEASPVSAPSPSVHQQKSREIVFSYRVNYSRLDDSRFYGHLELLQLVFRVLHRAGVPVLFSRGYNPSPRVSFSPALPVGVESLVEYFDMDLSRPMLQIEEAIQSLNTQFPETIRVTSIVPVKKQTLPDMVTTYQIGVSAAAVDDLEDRKSSFFAAEHFFIERVRKGKRRELDLRPLVQKLVINGDEIELTLISHHSRAGTNPREVLEKILGINAEQALLARIKKIGVEELTGNSCGKLEKLSGLR